MTCLGFQYKEGDTYTEEGAELCSRGFHACEDPIDCFQYYDPANSEYHEVELDETAPERKEDSKVVGKRITIGAKMSIAQMVQASIDFRLSKTTIEPAASATGDSGAASATGDRGAASATGDRGAASATGYRGAASATGYGGAASATGYGGAASATGYGGAASATGDSGAASATGDSGIALAAGFACKAMGALGCWIVLAERVWDDNENYYRIKAVKAYEVDGKKIMPGKWYMLKDGKPIEV